MDSKRPSDFKKMTHEEKQETMRGLRDRENKSNPQSLQNTLKSTTTSSTSTETLLGTSGQPSLIQATSIFSEDDRTFLKNYIHEEISEANTLKQLNNIYYEHSDRAYVTQHRQGSKYRADYTETKALLINQLRARATEIYNPKEKERINYIKNNFHLVLEQDLETLLLSEAKHSNILSNTTFPAYKNTEDHSDEEESAAEDDTPILPTPTPTRSLFLHFLLTREKELPKARFVSREHDSWVKQALNTIGGILYAPIGWLYRPTVYSASEKKDIRQHLTNEINAANSFKDLMNIYDRYKDAEFVKERRYGALLAERAYCKTRTAFITELRKKALELDTKSYITRNYQQGENLNLFQENSIRALDGLLSHAIFANAHEGTAKLGGVPAEHRIKLEESQSRQIGELNDNRKAPLLS